MMLRGLIVKEPFATLIVKGEKTWEIRKFGTKIRGFIVIISEGYAKGLVEIYDSKGPLSLSDLEDYYDYHKVPKEFLKKYAGKSQLYIWFLRNAIEFKKPIKIKVPKGAQVWVRLRKEDIIKILENEKIMKSTLRELLSSQLL